MQISSWSLYVPWSGIEPNTAISHHQHLNRHRPRTQQPSLSLPNQAPTLVNCSTRESAGLRLITLLIVTSVPIASMWPCVCVCTRKGSVIGKYMTRLQKSRWGGAMDDASPCLDRIFMISELDISTDNHLRPPSPSPPPSVTMKTVHSLVCAPHALPAHHEGPRFSNLHVMPPAPTLGLASKLRLPALTPSPGISRFITAMLQDQF